MLNTNLTLRTFRAVRLDFLFDEHFDRRSFLAFLDDAPGLYPLMKVGKLGRTIPHGGAREDGVLRRLRAV